MENLLQQLHQSIQGKQCTKLVVIVNQASFEKRHNEYIGYRDIDAVAISKKNPNDDKQVLQWL